MLDCSGLCFFGFTVVLLTPTLATPQFSRSSDPCGPPNTSANNISTCTRVTQPAPQYGGSTFSAASSLAKSSPSLYGVNCLIDNTDEVLHYASCMSNYDDLCLQLNQANPPRGQWLWSSGGPNCTFGAWIPADNKTSAPIPSYPRCRNQILGPMADWCGLANNGRSNVAAVNLKALPSDKGETGAAVDEHYLSYLMVAQTYHDTGILGGH